MEKVTLVGFGWLGLPLGEKLQNQGFDVLGTTTSLDKLEMIQNKGLSVIQLNLNSELNESDLMETFEMADVCVLTIPPSKTLFQSYQNQCLKLVSLFPKNTKFIFTSSTSVYSETVQLAYEDTQVLSEYNFTSQLFLTEKALRKELGDRLTILRLAGLFGENRNPAKFLAGKKDLKNPDGAVNLVHQEDVISFILEVIEQKKWGEVFNVCSSEHPTRQTFYAWMCEKIGLAVPVFEQTENQTQSKEVSNEKGKKTLSFSYKFDSPFDFNRM